ncbi:MAG: homogentisate 1,2-dioxygenase [Anaerolineales bacterium]|nr:homogentisate 1,2-dioxygenase [Anaerolineales bacterium]MBP6211072.1 homogentisate 1,2-dioxygenase [Anaerolineales bacterium]MBP8164963.1 homogentisate 1,2-dioxygenase [Anaerolineales bacterium]
MPFYHKLGQVPHKRHTQFKKPDGKLYREEVMGLEGFSSIQSILYHHFLPPRVKRTEDLGSAKPEYADFGPIRHRALQTDKIPLGADALAARIPLLGNNDVILGVSRTANSMDYFYRNSQAYEVWWVHDGSGTFKSQFGELNFRKGDYIVIPFGVTWQMDIAEECKFFTIECPSQIEPPKRYRNEYGQLLEHSPYCERDIRVPEKLSTRTERGEYDVRVKVRDRLSLHVLDHHPFDVVGWDGYLYPWIFNIEDFEPITGRLHMPPPIHQTFDAHNFVVCSFVPRLFDYHPDGIPAPYSHSNIQSDEVIYYAEGNFMSRKGIDRSDITLHPFGLPHGPQPGMTEASIGKKETFELAVMVDTFHPLQITKQALELEKPEYMDSWLEGDGE